VDYDHGGTTKSRGAETDELLGRGYSLVLEGCSEWVDVAEDRSTPFKRALTRLHLIFSPDDTFDVGADSDRLGDARAWWVRTDGPDRTKEWSEASIFDPGMDGYYFSISDGILSGHGSSFSVCTSANADEKSCRKFSMDGFREAVRFVCKMEVE
jgi:hypothetical protein